MHFKIVLNFILFQVGWFACVLGAAQQQPWLGAAVVLVCIAWHLVSAFDAEAEIILLVIALIIGGMFDQFMQITGLVQYQAHGWHQAIIPVWILALWLAFSTTLNVSLRWMRGRWLIAILFGLIGGPLAYLGAEKLGAVIINNGFISYATLAIGWAILTPLLIFIAQKFDGFDVKNA
ncbi:MAG: DUF2878 domain-containing protein [Methylophilaceae bacterium]